MATQNDGTRVTVYRSNESSTLVADLAHTYRLDLLRRGVEEPDPQVSAFIDHLARTTRLEGTLVVTVGVEGYLAGFLLATPQPRPRLDDRDSDLASLAVDTLAFASAAQRVVPDIADRLLDAASEHALGGRLWTTLVDAESDARFYRSRGWQDAPPAWAGVDADDVLVAPAPVHDLAESRSARRA